MSSGSGPVVFAYDGSELAKAAVEEAGRQLGKGRDALVVTVWEPMDVGFVPLRGTEFDAARTVEVQQAAEETAADGASLAKAAGFQARAPRPGHGRPGRASSRSPTSRTRASSCSAPTVPPGSRASWSAASPPPSRRMRDGQC